MTPVVNVILMDLTVNEAVTENADGSFTIFINARLNNEGQLEAYNHAMKHIENHDFQKYDVQQIETDAHAPEPIPADRFLKRLEELRMERKRIQRQMKRNQKKVEFMQQHGYDFLKMAQDRYYYGDD